MSTEFDEAFLARFASKVVADGDCLIWTAAKDNHGYGVVSAKGRIWKAHRAAYLIARGAIPDGLVIDHICHRRDCVNPQHLQAVSRLLNVENRRGPNPNSTSGIRGVTWSKRSGRWVVQVGHLRRHFYGGTFDSLEEAERAAIALRSRLMTNNLRDREAS